MKRKPRRRRGASARRPKRGGVQRWSSAAPAIALVLLLSAGMVVWARQHFTFTLRFPLLVRFQSPLLIEPRTSDESAAEADQAGRRLTPYQAYACTKFGPACRVALAIQRAENARGDCEVYHYNSDGTLDWGYFQINTVHLKRPGLNLRDLLSCKANIDFAYQLYLERGFAPWSTFNSGVYRKYLRE